MAARTPPSLKWLIDKRSRLAGRLKALDSDLNTLRAQAVKLEEERPKVLRQLEAIDMSMGLHDIQIDPAEIATTTPRRNEWLLPKGCLTRVIFRTLKNRGEWMSTDEIAWIVFLHLLEEEKKVCDLPHVTYVVRKRLCNLVSKGTLARRAESPLAVDLPGGHQAVVWRLSTSNS